MIQTSRMRGWWECLGKSSLTSIYLGFIPPQSSVPRWSEKQGSRQFTCFYPNICVCVGYNHVICLPDSPSGDLLTPPCISHHFCSQFTFTRHWAKLQFYYANYYEVHKVPGHLEMSWMDWEINIIPPPKRIQFYNVLWRLWVMKMILPILKNLLRETTLMFSITTPILRHIIGDLYSQEI